MTETPPFFGSKAVEGIRLEDFERLIDRTALFVGRWQFRAANFAEDWKRLEAEKIIPIYERIRSQVMSKSLLEPRVLRGYFRCEKSGNLLIVRGERKPYRFDFPREKRPPHRSIADFFPSGFAAFQIVTIGNAIGGETAKAFGGGNFSESFYLKGFAAEAAEALAKYGHSFVKKELGAGDEEGERFSPGYPSFPSLLDQRSIVALLESAKIGVTLTKTCMLVPEHSTSAIISIDPKAARFNPNLL